MLGIVSVPGCFSRREVVAVRGACDRGRCYRDQIAGGIVSVGHRSPDEIGDLREPPVRIIGVIDGPAKRVRYGRQLALRIVAKGEGIPVAVRGSLNLAGAIELLQCTILE